MDTWKMFPRLLLAASALLIVFSAPARAQDSNGIIRGKVTDLGTGEPLAAATILLLNPDGTETPQGTMTNSQGEYLMVNVPAGRHGLKVRMRGYVEMTLGELIVTVGGSIQHNFQLAPEEWKPGEMLDRRITRWEQSYTGEEIERMPVRSTTDILTLQGNITRMTALADMIPGYHDRGLEQIHLRGGRNAEVAFMIDGLQATNLNFGGQAAPVNLHALSEMVIMAGGMSAEYGNAMSGVVNLITREGGRSNAGALQVDTGQLSGQPQDEVRRATNLNMYFGGPVPQAWPNMSFFLSGGASGGADYIARRDNNVFHHDINPYDPSAYRPEIDYRGVNDPDSFSRLVKGDDPYLQYEAARPWMQLHPLDVYSGWLGYGYDNQWNGMLNITGRWNPRIKLTLSGHFADRWALPYTHDWRMAMQWGFPEWWQDYLKWGGLRYDAGDYTDYNQKIIPGTGTQGWHNEKNVLRIDNRRLSFVFQHQVNPSTRYSLRGLYHGYNHTMRVDRWINEQGWVARREYAYPIADRDTTYRFTDEMIKVTLGPFGYTSGIRDHLDFYTRYDAYQRGYGYIGMHGAGLGYTGSDRYFTDHHDITRSIKADVTSQVSARHQVKAGLQYNALTLIQYELQLLYLDPPYYQDYRRSPWEFSAYLHETYEDEELVINIGVRFEARGVRSLPFWVSPRNVLDQLTGQVVMDPFDPYAAQSTVRTETTPMVPRFGISHPVTERAVVYFNYGHFYQNPSYRNLFKQGTLWDAFPLIGNPKLEREKTVSYEFGMKSRLTDIMTFEATLWLRTSSNMVGTERIPSWFRGQANPYTYTVYLNYDYAASRGVDLALHRRFSDNWSGRLYYTTMRAEANRDDPGQGYRDLGLGVLERQPKRARPVGWSVPHRFSSDIFLALPQGFGPALAGIRPFESMGASLLFRAASGRPYTPTTAEGPREPRSARMPWTFSLDGHLYKDLTLLGRRVSLYAHIANMFDRRNVLTVFSRTGRADDPGPVVAGYSDLYDRFHHYSPPRRIDLGIRLFYP